MDNPATPIDVLASATVAVGDLQRLLSGHPGVVLVLGAQGSVFDANPAGRERLGRGQEPIGEDGDDLLIAPVAAPGTSGAAAPSLAEALQSGRPHDWAFRHHDGSTRTLRLDTAALRNRAGATVGWIAVEPAPGIVDEGLPTFHHHDMLTGLATRAVLADRAEMALQRASRQKSVVAILLVEIAGFDAMRAEHGADVGDDVLRATASRLHFELRKTDTAVRLDNGQFAVLLVDLHHADEAMRVAAKIGGVLSSPIQAGESRLSLAARIGVAVSPTDGDQLLPLMQAAEAALGGVDATKGGVAAAVEPVTA